LIGGKLHISGRLQNDYDTAMLISSDTDLIPAIQYIRSEGKKLEYIEFSRAPSFGLQKNADLSVLLRPIDIEKFKANSNKK